MLLSSNGNTLTPPGASMKTFMHSKGRVNRVKIRTIDAP